MMTRLTIAVLLAFGIGMSEASADCTAEANTPIIYGFDHASGSSAVTIKWAYAQATFCVWPPDFYQVRWTQGDGPLTQNQSPQIPFQDTNDGYSWQLTGIDPNQVYGFIVQACSNNFLAPATCTQWSPMAYYKPYGPGMCKTGFLWRNAFSGDKVCVTPTQQGEVVTENADGPGLTQPDGKCRSGYVWRQARPSDHVCVTPDQRTMALQENGASPGNALPYTNCCPYSFCIAGCTPE